MRFGFVRILAVGCVCALTSLAQQQLSVSKLVEFIHSSITLKTPDKEVAGFLASVKLTEKLDTRTVENLQGQGAGPKTVAALRELAAEKPSALLCFERDPAHCHRTLLLAAEGEGAEVVDLFP